MAWPKCLGPLPEPLFGALRGGRRDWIDWLAASLLVCLPSLLVCYAYWRYWRYWRATLQPRWGAQQLRLSLSGLFRPILLAPFWLCPETIVCGLRLPYLPHSMY